MRGWQNDSYASRSRLRFEVVVHLMLLGDMTQLHRKSEPSHQDSINGSKSSFESHRPKARKGKDSGHDDDPWSGPAVTLLQGVLLHLDKDFLEIKMSRSERRLVTVVDFNRGGYTK